MYKVMIVDDMNIFRRHLKLLPIWGNSSGFTITEEAVDGFDAVRKLKAEPVDLVITDIKMPGMDGMELLQVISERKLCPYVVILSDYTEYTYARQGFVYGAFDYIGKPVKAEELAALLERIKKQLEEKQQEEQKRIELQEIIEDNFFHIQDVRHIAKMINQGNEKANTMVSDVLVRLLELPPSERNKTLMVLKNTINKVLNEIVTEHPWIEQYSYINQFFNVDYEAYEWPELKDVVEKVVKYLLSVINQFIPNRDSTTVVSAYIYILENMNENLSVQLVAEKLFISKAHLSEIFKQKTRMTILEYITMAKMERTKMLLMEGQLKNYEIADLLGYRDIEYFNKLFKKYTGLSLTEFKQSK